MRKLILSILLSVLLIAPLSAQQYRFDKSEEKHIRVFLPKGKGNGKMTPQVRKCLTVKCAEGYYCFHGRCVELDKSCLNVKCNKGFRCVKGSCVQKKHQPKKLICLPLDFKLEKQRCDKDQLKECRQNKVVARPVCGFNPKTKEYRDYASPCDACTDRQIKINFFYETTCDDAPRVCDEDEECINGICTTLFNGPEFDNKESCNQNSDCDANEYCAAHKCIDRRDIFNYLDSVKEVSPILLKIA